MNPSWLHPQHRISLFAISWAVVLFLALPFSSTAMATSSSSSSPSRECAVVGVGVLGTSLCQQLLDNGWTVTGITKTTTRHDEIRRQVLCGVDAENNSKFQLQTADQPLHTKFPYCVFCAPPSGFDDYPAAVKEAMTTVWDSAGGGGSFVFTSSGGIYGPGDNTGIIPTVNEDSPLPDPSDNPRSARLMGAEQVVRAGGGTILRLAGLYTLDRGAHNFWMGKEEVGGRADGIINLLHYDDAAGSVVAALQVEDPSTTIQGKTFLISDGHPLTRQQICESTLKSSKYRGMSVPKFTGTDSDPMGKLYDGSATATALHWKPRYPSFDAFMSAS